MIDFLLTLDKEMYYFINVTLSNSVFDVFFPFITNVKYWLPVYIIGLILLIWKGGARGRILFLVLILTIVVVDQVNSSLLKEWVGRIRPCHTLDDINLLVGCGGGKSFPSSHAANNFAAAFVITHYYKKRWWIFYSIAFVVAISRVFVGVHYPIDILGGAAVGVLFGFVLVLLAKPLENKFLAK